MEDIRELKSYIKNKIFELEDQQRRFGVKNYKAIDAYSDVLKRLNKMSEKFTKEKP